VRYFSQGKERIFVRTKAIVGRKVQQCHPQKSIHIVNQILDAFKKGNRDVAEFWLNLKNRLVLIRYFAVRDRKGAYLGCLEVTQDITDIKKNRRRKKAAGLEIAQTRALRVSLGNFRLFSVVSSSFCTLEGLRRPRSLATLRPHVPQKFLHLRFRFQPENR
jgi:hypothetical protein